jgi:hypothetical protein
VITASSVCDCDRFVLVSSVKMFWHSSIVSVKVSVHFLTSVSLRLKRRLLDGALICHLPWSSVHVMGKWSDVNDNS